MTDKPTKPTHRLSYLEEFGPEEDRPPKWHNVTGLWPTKDGEGLKGTIDIALPKGAKLVIRRNESSHLGDGLHEGEDRGNSRDVLFPVARHYRG